jgi:chloramphenicol-sensitive protein RarD
MQGPAAIDPAAARVRARQGLVAAIVAFVWWGVFPLYLALLRGATPLEIIAHRVVWSCGFVLGWLAVYRQLGELWRVLRTPALCLRLGATALLVSVNWLTFVWAVGAGRVLDASLGYFINPLVNVVLGVFLLGERLSPRKWQAVALAALGVAWLTVEARALPWTALILALTFSTYGLMRKVVAVEAVVGLGAETLLLAPLAAGYLGYLTLSQRAAFGAGDLRLDALLVLSGVVTAVPLALFAFGARRIPYTTVGVVQYIGPTLQFLSGVFLFGEPFSQARLLGFGLIWLALLLYAADGWRSARAEARAR